VRIKLYIFIIAVIVFASSCGKKLPPPSPDIFPAKIISGYYIPNSQIRIDFNENIDNTFDSAFFQIDSIRQKIEGYTKEKSVYLYYDFDKSAKLVDLFGVSDSKKNKRDYISIQIKGTVQKDTMPPNIIKHILSDSTLLIEFTEDISSCSLFIYPNYILYEYEIINNKILITYSDTCGYYPLQFYIESASDKKQNKIKNPFEFRFFDAKDSSSFVHLRIDSRETNADMILFDSDGNEIFRRKTNETGSILFDNLKQGRYIVKGDGFLLDTLLLR